MKMTIVINTTEPDYPVGFAMDHLEDFIKLVLAIIPPEVEDEGRYPITTISDRDAPGKSALTVIDATIELDGVRQGKLW